MIGHQMDTIDTMDDTTVLNPAFLENRPFRVIVAGSRNFPSRLLVRNRIHTYIQELLVDVLEDTFFDPRLFLEIVSGCARRGPDQWAIEYAEEFGWPLVKFPADWVKYNGRTAGIVRNKQMGDYATHLLAFWDGRSNGTKHMIRYMQSLDKPTDIVIAQ